MPAPRRSTNPKTVLVEADPQLRETLSGLTNTMLIRRCAHLESTTPQDVTSAAVYTLRLLARRILQLIKDIHDLVHHITDTITRHCPRLLTRAASAPTTPPPCSSLPATIPTDCAAKPPLPPCVGSTHSKHPQEKPAVAAKPRRRPPSQLRALPQAPYPGCAGIRGAERIGPGSGGSTRLPRSTSLLSTRVAVRLSCFKSTTCS